MKKTTLIGLFIILLCVSLFIFASCGVDPESILSGVASEEAIRSVYTAYAEAGGELSYEEWLASVKGDAGVGIVSIDKVRSEGHVDYYEIALTNGNKFTYTVTNADPSTQNSKGDKGDKGDKGNKGDKGVGIESVTLKGSEGLVDTYTITLTNGETYDFTVTNGQKGDAGRGIDRIAKTGSEGAVDTYTIYYTDGETYVFTVTNGTSGAVVDPDAPTADEYFRFTLLNDGTYEIGARYHDMPERVVIPSTHNGAAVTAIAADFGLDTVNYTVREVVLPDSIKRISGSPFLKYKALVSLSIPASLEVLEGTPYSESPDMRYRANGNCFYMGNEENPYLVLVKATVPTITDCVISDRTLFIAEDAFKDCASLTSVTIPDGVTSVCEGAFEGAAVETAVIPACAASAMPRDTLKNLTITSGSALRAYALRGCTALTSVTFPQEGLETIALAAFEGCSSLTEISIPDSVLTFGDRCFSGCPIERAAIPGWAAIRLPKETLKSVTISRGAAERGFEGFGALTSVTFVNAAYIRDYAFKNCVSLASVMIPEGMTSIGIGAFYGCTSLKEIVLPASIHEWGTAIFEGCPIENVILPAAMTSLLPKDSLKSVGLLGEYVAQSAFENCTSLTTLILDSTVSGIMPRAFKGCTSLANLSLPGVVAIAEEAFMGCTALASLDLKEGAFYIGRKAFSGCTSLTTVALPSSMQTIEEYAFEDCPIAYAIMPAFAAYSLNNGTLRNVIVTSGTTLGARAFADCAQLTQVVLPSTIKSVHDSAFSGCTNLEYHSYGNAGYLGNGENPYVILMKASSTDITECTIHADTQVVYANAFRDCTALTSIVLPAGLKSIGGAAFMGCTALSEAALPQGLESLGDNCFRDTALTSVTIPVSVTGVKSHAFRDCTSLTSLTFAEGSTLRSIGTAAFQGCVLLSSVAIPASVESIMQNAFAECEALSSVTFAEGSALREIDGFAFLNCAELASFIIPDGVVSVSNGAFNGCDKMTFTEYEGAYYLGSASNSHAMLFSLTDKSVTEFVIHPDTETINAGAFQNCTALTELVIPVGVKRIGSTAFRGCTALASVTFTEGIELISIGNAAFQNCTALTEIVLPDGLASLSTSLFKGCTNLASVTIPVSVLRIWTESLACASLSDVYYQGTEAAWEAIQKSTGWDKDAAAFTVHFDDPEALDNALVSFTA